MHCYENLNLYIFCTLNFFCFFNAAFAQGDDCYAEAGVLTIAEGGYNVCFENTVVVEADEFLLEDGQQVFYIWHDVPGINWEGLTDYSNIVSFGNFLVNDLGGQTVYVTAFGILLNTESGIPDFNDSCLTTSNTIPINFLRPVQVYAETDCDPITNELTYQIQVNGGLPEIDSSQLYHLTSSFYEDSIGINDTLFIDLNCVNNCEFELNVQDNNFCESEFQDFHHCVLVPIYLISLTVEAKKNGNLIKWATELENNVNEYILSSSTDGLNFDEIYRVQALNNLSYIKEYEYLDAEAKEKGTTYYKLSEIKFNEQESLLGIVSISRGLEQVGIISLMPNPVVDNLTVLYAFEKSQELFINVINSTGLQPTITKRINHSSGIGYLTMDVSFLEKGVHFVELSFDGKKYIRKFIK